VCNFCRVEYFVPGKEGTAQAFGLGLFRFDVDYADFRVGTVPVRGDRVEDGAEVLPAAGPERRRGDRLHIPKRAPISLTRFPVPLRLKPHTSMPQPVDAQGYLRFAPASASPLCQSRFRPPQAS
jgi:hypothetical protein